MLEGGSARSLMKKEIDLCPDALTGLSQQGMAAIIHLRGRLKYTCLCKSGLLP